MIQLYNSNNTNYEKNGDCVLMPETAKLTAEIKGTWSLELVHPLDSEGRWKYLKEEAVLKAPSFNNDQLFRIRRVEKDDFEVSVTAEPIFFDCRNDTVLRSLEIEDATGASALDDMFAGTRYTGYSDILDVHSTKFDFCNLLEALTGSEASFTAIWGGEPIYDDFAVTINSRAGNDNGVEIRYGKNIPENGMKVEVDMSEVATRLYPTAYNGHALSGTGYVDSSRSYAIQYSKAIEFDDVMMWEDATPEDEENPNITVCMSQAELDAALRARCNKEFGEGIDLPKVTITVDMVLLQNTEQYADIASLESVTLGDTIHCYNTHLDIVTDERVVALVYDCVLNSIESVTLGGSEEKFYNNIESRISASEITVTHIQTVADYAKRSADGKSKVFHQASQPAQSVGLTVGDTWFDTDDGYKMYVWNGTSWAAEAFGNQAIADLAITNAKIEDGTIEHAKIASMDAGKITVGFLDADHIATESITIGKLAPAVTDSIGDARKYAENYIVVEGGKLMVADMENGAETPSTATTRNVLIDSDSVDIRNGRVVLASFGTQTIIGQKGNNRIIVDSSGIQGINDKEVNLFNISLDGATRSVFSYTPKQEYGSQSPEYFGAIFEWELPEDFVSSEPIMMETDVNLTITNYQAVYASNLNELISTTYKVFTIRGVAINANFTYNSEQNKLTVNIWPAGEIVVTHRKITTAKLGYYRNSIKVPTFALGTDISGEAQAFSCIIGENLSAASENQIVVGKNNEEDADAVFIVANGEALDDPTHITTLKNLLTVKKSGKVIAPDTLAVGKYSLSYMEPNDAITCYGRLIFSDSEDLEKNAISVANSKFYFTPDGGSNKEVLHEGNYTTYAVPYIREARDINFGSTILPCAGRITGSGDNASKVLSFFVPWAKACAGTFTMKELKITVCLPTGGFPYARSGSGGGTYTALGAAAGVEIWSNGRTVRTNEISSVAVTPVDGSGLRVDVTFNYAIAKASGSTAAVTNQIPVFVAKNAMIVTRS